MSMSASTLVRGALFALAVHLSGCIIVSGTATRAKYDTCTTSDTCGGVTTCVSANTTTSTGGTAGRFCSTSCYVSTDCPTDPSGNAVTCVTAGSTSQCYRLCGTGCPAGQTCATAGGQNFCVPNAAGAVSCGATGQACCNATTCNTGLVCNASGMCTTPPCGGASQACCAGNVCNTGNVCTTTGQCTACGGAQQPCCASNTCTTGLACGTDGLCSLAPYTGCNSASVTAMSPCLSGISSTGSVVPTSCQRPMIPNAGATGFCTSTCTGLASQCPGWLASPSRAYNCYIMNGTTVGQCYVDCNTNMTCPDGTVCVQAATTTATVQICMPPPV